MWFESLLAKKFQLPYPFVEKSATALAEGMPSLKNFKANPGAKLSKAPYAVVFVTSGYFANENLIIP
jgi:hypothetical protein